MEVSVIVTPTGASYEHDLAISAVVYDTLLVSELMMLLASRLPESPAWSGAVVTATKTGSSPLDDNVSRVALVLVQRLWGRDAITAVDAEVLRERAHRNPNSVIVVSLDGEGFPAWMSRVPRHDLATLGVEGIVDLVLEAIADAGGRVTSPPKGAPTRAIASAPRWPDPPIPFLGQTRAHGALRREFDLLVAELERRVEDDEGSTQGVLEVHALPNRAVARIDDVGVSFSWVPARSGSVADGRLMVIEWSGIVGKGRGVAAALQTAHPVRECVYVAEAANPDQWCWRVDGPHGRASSTVHLVAEWVAAASMRHGTK
jgi:hypothetical protein